MRTAGVVLSTLFLVAGCGSGSTADEPTSESTTSSSSSTRTTPSTTASTETTPQAKTAESAAPTAVSPASVGPTLLECVYGGGAWTETGWMSDGTYGYHPQCAALRSEQLDRYPYRCPQTDHQVADLSECAYPTGIPVAPEPQGPSSVPTPEKTDEPVTPPVEPETGDELGTDPSEPGDTSEVCQE